MEKDDLKESIERVDNLLTTNPPSDDEQLMIALGIRLALGMAQEISEGKPLGSKTGELIAGWVKDFGEKSVEAAVNSARSFLLNPKELKEGIEKRLFAGDKPGAKG